MKGYKGFEPGLICKGKQYAENTVFEEDEAVICQKGMHFCAAPLDVLDHYPIINENGELNEFAEVEALDEVKTVDNKKYVTKKLKIGGKISIKRLGELHAEYIREVVKANRKDSGCGSNQVGGDSAKQVGGDSANQVGGDYANQVGGNSAKQVGGFSAKQVGGNYAKQVGGYSAKQVGGNYANQVGGDYANQVGDDYAKQVGGDYANQVGGKNCIMVAVENSRFKAGLHSVILHYWYDDDYNIAGFKATQIDGVNLLPDTWYTLKDGEFVPV